MCCGGETHKKLTSQLRAMSSLFKTLHHAKPSRIRCLSFTSCANKIFFTRLSHVTLRSTTAFRPQGASFSTMSALQSDASPTIGTKEYDSEIKDMASYVHKYKIQSDLAVRFALSNRHAVSADSLPVASLTLLDMSSSTP